MTKLITRFAPSPTGHLHIGGARTALFNWLLARQSGGRFLLRIEDTDAQRSTEEFTQAILSAMTWLGLDWDGEITYQRLRKNIHKEYIDRLLAEGKAYWCHCPPEETEAKRRQALALGGKPKYDGTCRDRNLSPAPGATVRFKTPLSGLTAWNDLIKGPVSFENSELDDLIILKSDGMPTYNLAVVVDDLTMNLTHVLRGDDHVNNTPRQILLYQALGADLPLFAHLPMILGADKARLSKRHGATSVMAYKEMGYLPQALVNYLARLGWSHGDQEIFSLAELTEYFSLGQVGRSAGVFNPEKLLWLNAHYIKETPDSELARLVWPYLAASGYKAPNEAYLNRALATVKERGKTLQELADMSAFYFQETIAYEPKAAAKFLTPDHRALLAEIGAALQGVPFTILALEEAFHKLAAARNLKLGALAQPLRVALTGKTASPGLFEIMEILGPERVTRRLKAALAHH